MSDIFGELGRDAVYAEAFGNALRMLWSDGTKASLEAYLDGRL